MHELQLNPKLSWDTKLSTEFLKQWKNIVKQANSSFPLDILFFEINKNICLIILQKIYYI